MASGAPFIERVDLLVKLISHELGAPNAEIDRTTCDHLIAIEAFQRLQIVYLATMLIASWFSHD